MLALNSASHSCCCISGPTMASLNVPSQKDGKRALEMLHDLAAAENQEAFAVKTDKAEHRLVRTTTMMALLHGRSLMCSSRCLRTQWSCLRP